MEEGEVVSRIQVEVVSMMMMRQVLKEEVRVI